MRLNFLSVIMIGEKCADLLRAAARASARSSAGSFA